jgi:hypothetical protein
MGVTDRQELPGNIPIEVSGRITEVFILLKKRTMSKVPWELFVVL